MDGIARGNVEILVHARAPSRGQDDARYRTLARAYLDFEPANRRELTADSRTEGVQHEDIQARSQLHEELIQSTPKEPDSQASYRPESQTESPPVSNASFQNSRLSQLTRGLYSPELSFNSVLDNANSPDFRDQSTWPKESRGAVQGASSQKSVDSWKQTPSTIADSQPENNIVLAEFSSPTRILELYLQQIESSEEPSPERRRHARGFDATSPQQLGTLQKQSLLSQSPIANSTTSGEPSSPSPQRPTVAVLPHIPQVRKQVPSFSQDPGISLKRRHLDSSPTEVQTSSSAPVTGTTKAPIIISSSTTNSSKRKRIELSQIEQVTQSRESNGSTENPQVEGMNRSIEVTPSQVTKVASSFQSSQRPSFASILEVRPPPPPISSANMTEDILITESLHQLVRKMPIEKFFYVESQTRVLRPMERGYWLISCKTWKEELRRSNWDFLGGFIAQGKAGWGVWCVRDENFETVRVYCWGCVVAHIYMLLFMSSERKVKGIGASWIGGDGEAVIIMPG